MTLTTLLLSAAVVVLGLALALVIVLWQIAASNAYAIEDFVLAMDDALDGFMLDVDAAQDLRAEAEMIREWRGEVKGDD
jgi:hypothetical protein